MLTLMGGILFVDISGVCEDCVMNMCFNDNSYNSYKSWKSYVTKILIFTKYLDNVMVILTTRNSVQNVYKNTNFFVQCLSTEIKR